MIRRRLEKLFQEIRLVLTSVSRKHLIFGPPPHPNIVVTATVSGSPIPVYWYEVSKHSRATWTVVGPIRYFESHI